MPIRRVLGSVHTDTDVRDGYVEILVDEDGEGVEFMSPATFHALVWHNILGPTLAACREMGPGTHLVPRSLIERTRAREVEQELTFVEPGESDTCALPTCLQDSVTRERGFPLCEFHAAQLADWDSLVG